jgi:hypothetical protein
MIENIRDSKQKMEYELSLKQRNFEIDLFWKRSWFFGALILAEIAGYYKLKTENMPIIEPIFVVTITFITACAQCLMNRGSKYWQERWEYMTINREAALGIELTRLKNYNDKDVNEWLQNNINDYNENDRNEWLFIESSFIAKRDNLLTSARRFSVSKLTMLVWDLVFICTFMCWLLESFQITSSCIDWYLTIRLAIFYFFTFGYIFIFFRNGKVFEPFKKELLMIDNSPLEIKRRLNNETTTMERISNMYLSDTVKKSFKKIV